ncbi:hypothetical protein Ade02nite_07560 [Paractinoplanes deccanensis]|uniref:Uncharacterized protein n=1 Tax=Paractinoplanes deccanensis TaxID=113561 RepID=A0ABQ3XWI7_9ACTN|nr:hypothetical protein [Actinoplanes deccanensis]GID72115.1 hypothetical protein Ade02nite_07560 [Actinoplanes deccanensis]
MSAPTVDAPPAPRVAMRFVVEGPPVRALWRRALLRAALVPLPVLAPLVALTPSRDHRFNIYWHGGLFRENPLAIVPHTVDSLPGYLRLGNFRLFGRMLEKALDLAAYALGDVLGLPANVAFRLVSFVSAVLLCVVALLLVESVVSRGQLFARPPSSAAAVVPFAVAAGFVAAGGSSPIVLFGGLYLASAALVLGVAAALCRLVELRLWWAPLLALGGASLAAFNEIAYLAPPLATVAVLARGHLVLGHGPRQMVASAAAKAVGLLWVGFLPVFLAVRVVIHRYCATGRCYRGSDVQFGPETFEALPVRAIAWLPPLLWQAAVRGGSPRPWLFGVVLVTAVVVLAALARHALRDLPRLSAVDRRPAAALAVVAVTAVLLGAGMGSLNADVQRMTVWGLGWRDSAVTTTAGGLIVVAALLLAARRRRWVLVAAVVVLAGATAVSAAANKRQRDTVMASVPARLYDRIAVEMADFDRTPAGERRRCALRTEFAAIYPESLRRFDAALSVATEQRAGVPFCPGVTR